MWKSGLRSRSEADSQNREVVIASPPGRLRYTRCRCAIGGRVLKLDPNVLWFEVLKDAIGCEDEAIAGLHVTAS